MVGGGRARPALGTSARWRFTSEDARLKLRKLYPSIELRQRTSRRPRHSRQGPGQSRTGFGPDRRRLGPPLVPVREPRDSCSGPAHHRPGVVFVVGKPKTAGVPGLKTFETWAETGGGMVGYAGIPGSSATLRHSTIRPTRATGSGRAYWPPGWRGAGKGRSRSPCSWTTRSRPTMICGSPCHRISRWSLSGGWEACLVGWAMPFRNAPASTTVRQGCVSSRPYGSGEPSDGNAKGLRQV